MFRLTPETAAQMIADESALATLRSYPITQVLEAIEDIGAVEDEEDAFNALMEAMYALRPQGVL